MDGVTLGVFQLLDAGGNVAMMALLYVMWRFDRRLLALELLPCRAKPGPVK